MELEPRKKEIGEILKAERAKKGLSLEEVQRATKVNKKFIRALEGGDFSFIPTTVAARGFLRIYAVYLELDPDPMVVEFNEKFGPPRTISKPGVTKVIDNGRRTASFEYGSYLKYAVYAFAAIIVLLFLYYVRTYLGG